MFFFSKKKLIGLDIGASSIKIAELDVGRTSSLVSFGVVPTPPQAFVGGDITDSAAIAQAIKELGRKIGTKRNDIVTGLSGTSVIIKKITIPKMEEKLIADQIRWEAEQYIPYDINEVNLGYEILHTSNSAENMDLLLVAGIQSHVFKYAEAISVAGFECAILDVAGFALANCFKANYGDMDGQTIALLNIGATATTLVVMARGEVIFCRDIPVGGFNITLDLQKSLSVSLEEAESIKISAGSGQQVPAEALGVLKNSLEIIVDEIRSSLEFFINSTQSQTVTRCFVTGGGVRTVGILEAISKIVPCEKMDPFYSIRANSKTFPRNELNKIRDIAATAIGLGLRQPGDE